MDDVNHEIVKAVELITTANTPEVQLAAIHKFFVPDAGFNHPLCYVPRGPGSREQILGIYQWYREMSPTIHLKVENYSWDESASIVYLNVIQTFKIWWSPFKSAPARLLVRLSLVRGESGKFLIAQQDDFYQPEDIANLMMARIAPLVYVGKRAGTAASNFNAWLFKRLFGWWSPVTTEGTRKASS